MATRTINWRWSSRPDHDSFRRDEIDCDPLPFERRRIQRPTRLRWRLTRWFSAAVTVLGLAAILLSYYTLPDTLRRHASANAQLPAAPPAVAGEVAVPPVTLHSVNIVPDVDRTFVAITLLILAAMVLAVAAASVVFGWLAEPLAKLVEVAQDMSLGALAMPIDISGSDAIARLGAALERIRRLLYAAIRRLNAEHNLALSTGARRLGLPAPTHHRLQRQ